MVYPEAADRSICVKGAQPRFTSLRLVQVSASFLDRCVHMSEAVPDLGAKLADLAQ